MSAAETPAEDDRPPLTSFEVPMEAVPAKVVPRLELAVRVPAPPPPPPADELPMESVPQLEAEPEPLFEPAFEPEAVVEPAPVVEPVFEPEPSAVTRPVELVDAADPVPPVRPVRPVRAAQSVRPVELDRRHPVRGLLGLVVVVVFGAIAVSLAVGAAIAAVLFAVRGGVGG